MKTLTLLRHAKSGYDEPPVRDFDRPLNAKGKRAALAVGRHLKGLGVGFDAVHASPARRVVETLAEVEAGYGRPLAPRWNKDLYLAAPATLLECVQALPDEVARVLFVGHNPGLEELVLLLVPDDAAQPLRDDVEVKFPTASLAEIGFDVARWAEVTPSRGTLTRFVRPRDLDATLGPDLS
jgi:phosphohistidine phosphatase